MLGLGGIRLGYPRWSRFRRVRVRALQSIAAVISWGMVGGCARLAFEDSGVHRCARRDAYHGNYSTSRHKLAGNLAPIK